MYLLHLGHLYLPSTSPQLTQLRSAGIMGAMVPVGWAQNDGSPAW